MPIIDAYQIDFLPVGDGERSGDAIALRWREDYGAWRTMIVDGGTKASGQALVDHFATHYDTNRVDYVVNTHPDADHASGLRIVIEQMDVGELWMHEPWNHAADIKEQFRDGRQTASSLKGKIEKALSAASALRDTAAAFGVPVFEPYAGATIGPFMVLSPDMDWYLNELLPGFRKTPAAKADEWSESGGLLEALKQITTADALSVKETWSLETLSEDGTTSAENESSVILYGRLADRGVLLTGDAGIGALSKAADLAEWCGYDLPSVRFVQVPHHGSRNNVSPSVLDRVLGPKQWMPAGDKTAFVSASAKSKTHPRRVVTNAFQRRGCSVCVTRGASWLHQHNAPRDDWNWPGGEPFHDTVEE